MTDRPDVLVIGGGTAALCAAIAARRVGARVSLLEQAPRGLRGGNTRHSRNLRIAHPEPTPFSLGSYPESEFLQDLLTATGGATDPALAALLVRRSVESTDWLVANGVHLQPTAGGLLPPSRKTVFLLGGGKALLNALYATAARLGVEIRYATGVGSLRLSGTRVEQIAISGPDGTGFAEPRALVAACGGTQANRDWLRANWGLAADGFVNRGTPHARGEVLLSMLEQGAAAVGDPGNAYLVAVDARSPADDGGIATRVRCMPQGIVVDIEGRRFHDEGVDTASTRYAVWGRRLAACPRQLAYVILDARGLRQAPPALYPPLTAQTLAGLAVALAIEPARLVATVADYNAAVCPQGDSGAWYTAGLDPPKSRHALPLVEPPFAAFPMRPGITFTYQGVAVDTCTRVCLTDGRCSENLFAAGVMMAPNIVGRGYVSGLSLTIGVVFGRIAGEEAARHALG